MEDGRLNNISLFITYIRNHGRYTARERRVAEEVGLFVCLSKKNDKEVTFL